MKNKAQMDVFSDTVQLGDWIVRLQRPVTPGPYSVFLLLHGLTGDENVMWIFATRLPQGALILAPRGMYPTPLGGYSWLPDNNDSFSRIDHYSPAIEGLLNLLTTENFQGGDFRQMCVVGFSQGAALTYALALQKPERIAKLAGLSGFLPSGAESLIDAYPLKGKSCFIAHGSQDSMVPVTRAHQTVSALKRAGADVVYCEDEIGHKLSANCFRGLELFFSENV